MDPLLPFPASYDVARYDYKEQDGAIPAIREQLSLTARNYASTSGKRMFLEPNILAKSRSRITTETARRSAIHLPLHLRMKTPSTLPCPQDIHRSLFQKEHH